MNSVARQGLEGVEVAVSDKNMLVAFLDFIRRPAFPRDQLLEGFLIHVPVRECELDKGNFSMNLRSVQRSVEVGFSGIISGMSPTTLGPPISITVCFFSERRNSRVWMLFK